ncbi:hypothetical protein ACJ73_03293 [Blastomyces percursus]|uniref:Uncharacterized protein n=1 Tax=Blastomyces percursus TaxID=1658174 RepID=A0A1J9QA77_9EURO|nr:hypothetical protein ACJ73_03293 [Blastomyces percursus]
MVQAELNTHHREGELAAHYRANRRRVVKSSRRQVQVGGVHYKGRESQDCNAVHISFTPSTLFNIFQHLKEVTRTRTKIGQSQIVLRPLKPQKREVDGWLMVVNAWSHIVKVKIK